MFFRQIVDEDSRKKFELSCATTVAVIFLRNAYFAGTSEFSRSNRYFFSARQLIPEIYTYICIIYIKPRFLSR